MFLCLKRRYHHSDLKPDNILLGIDQTVHIVDFGLAAQLVRRGYAPGVVGTFAYMAPETLQGESVPASDVYSIGLILYTGLTGIHPFSSLRPAREFPEQRYRDWLYEQKKTRHLPPHQKLLSTLPHSKAVLSAIIRPERLFLALYTYYQHAYYQRTGSRFMNSLPPSRSCFPPSRTNISWSICLANW